MRRSPIFIFIILCCLIVSLDAKGPSVFHLGPTGFIGSISKTTIKVTKVEKGSPADGKIKVGAQIIGAGGKAFKKDVRRELAKAINDAETEKAGGKLELILKGNKKIEIQIDVLGIYSDTAPYNCKKSETIIKRAADFLVKSGKADQGVVNSGLLGLMATGEKKYIEEATRLIKKSKMIKPNEEDFKALIRGDKDLGYVGWYWGYNLITLAEYHFLTGDKSVLPAIKIYATYLARGQDAGGLWGHRMATVKRNGRLPGYAQMNQSSLSSFMGLIFAKKCGITEPDLLKGIQKTYRYYETFVGKGAFNYGVHGPNSRSFNNNGTSGSAALCMSLLENKKGAQFFSQLCSTSYKGLETGHASNFFNPLWTPLGANLAGPEVTQQFFKKSLHFQTVYRSWDGSFSRFGGNSKEGPQAGLALLAYCLPRKALYITGKEADESIWLDKNEATASVGMSEIDYKNLSNEALMKLAMDHEMPQVRRAASGQLVSKRDEFIPLLIKYLKSGSNEEKLFAISQYGWWIPIEKRMPQMEEIGVLLRDPKEDLEVRIAATGSLCFFGDPAQKFYPDIIKLIDIEKAEDHFGDSDWALSNNLNKLCSTPFTSGLVKDKAMQYRVAIKLANNKRQHVRANGLRLLADMPAEDFHIVADTVMHVIKDQDSTYHSYHSPGGPVGAGISILAHLNIKEGVDLTTSVLDMESGKWGFKIRMVMSILPKFGANAKEALAKLKTDKRLATIEKGRFKGLWNNMVKTIEEDKNPKKLISFAEAKKRK